LTACATAFERQGGGRAEHVRFDAAVGDRNNLRPRANILACADLALLALAISSAIHSAPCLRNYCRERRAPIISLMRFNDLDLGCREFLD
jgi:hypothetical protein